MKATMSGTSQRTPMTVANAAADPGPKRRMAVAMAISKCELLAMIVAVTVCL